jgi:hypothetical protein
MLRCKSPDAVGGSSTGTSAIERVTSKGLPILQITAAAGDTNFHGLASVGHHVASDCAKGLDDDTLINRHKNKNRVYRQPALTGHWRCRLHSRSGRGTIWI